MRILKAGALYFAVRDPVSGTVYAVMLAVFAVMPLLVQVPRSRSQIHGSSRDIEP
jgi:hypothetical protein